MAQKVKPIRPEDLPKQKRKQIPNLIIETVNKLITKNWSTETREATVYQDDILKESESNSTMTRFSTIIGST